MIFPGFLPWITLAVGPMVAEKPWSDPPPSTQSILREKLGVKGGTATNLLARSVRLPSLPRWWVPPYSVGGDCRSITTGGGGDSSSCRFIFSELQQEVWAVAESPVSSRKVSLFSRNNSQGSLYIPLKHHKMTKNQVEKTIMLSQGWCLKPPKKADT